MHRPEGFDLAQAWAQVVDMVDELRAPAKVRVAVNPAMVDVVRWVFDKEATAGSARHDGRVEFVVAGSSVDLIARRLARFVGAVLVLDAPQGP